MKKGKSQDSEKKESGQFELQIQQHPEPVQLQEQLKEETKPKRNSKQFKQIELLERIRKISTGSQDDKSNKYPKQSEKNVLLEQHPQIDKEQENKIGVSSKRKGSLNTGLSMCIQQVNETIPGVILQTSPKGQKFINVKIPMYRTTSFLKIQTQIFILDVAKPGTLRQYQIQRRYSDFVEFYEQMFYNHPGYILAPFPDKGIQSFVKIKLGVGSQQPGERCEMIEKRMFELEKFINFVTHHRQLCNSEQLAIFITQDPQIYEQGKKRLEEYVTENRNLQKASHLKNIYQLGKSFWNSYVKKQSPPKKPHMSVGKNDIQLGIIIQTVKTHKQKTLQQYNTCKQLYQTQKSFSQFIDMPTQNDLLLKLCSKHSSGRQYCKNFSYFLEINILDGYLYNIKRYEEIQKILNYRIEVWNAIQAAKEEGNNEKKDKLMRRLALFQRNFMTDWEENFTQIQESNQGINQKFVKEWKAHKKLMRKIWKPAKKD